MKGGKILTYKLDSKGKGIEFSRTSWCFSNNYYLKLCFVSNIKSSIIFSSCVPPIFIYKKNFAIVYFWSEHWALTLYLEIKFCNWWHSKCYVLIMILVGTRKKDELAKEEFVILSYINVRCSFSRCPKQDMTETLTIVFIRSVDYSISIVFFWNYLKNWFNLLYCERFFMFENLIHNCFSSNFKHPRSYTGKAKGNRTVHSAVCPASFVSSLIVLWYLWQKC